MVGLIWVVQVVHYPLFARVGVDHFVSYERAHTKRMAALIAVPASTEIGLAAVVAWTLPEDVPIGLALAAGSLLAAVWLLTAVVQVRHHRRLSQGFDTEIHRRLVASNWPRTAIWSIRGVLAAVMLV